MSTTVKLWCYGCPVDRTALAGGSHAGSRSSADRGISLGSLPVSKAWMLLFFGYIYSAGALLIREAVRRRHLAVGSMLALGLAFGLVEEGLALGSLTSTTLYPVADWAPRLLGFNTACSLWVLPYHAVFSIVVQVAIVDLIFPTLKAEPYLRTRGIVAWAVALVLGLGVIRLALVWMDPDHVTRLRT